MSGEWKTIDSAPIDTKVQSWDRTVLLSDGYCIFIGFWNGRSWDDGDYNSNIVGMTHWMPLPDLPKFEPHEPASSSQAANS